MHRFAIALAVALAVTSLSSTASAERKFVGVKSCKTCHKSAKRGDQYTKWKNGPHAKAYATLATDRAREVAAMAGVKGDPQKSAKCLSCHVTGHGKPASAFGRKYKLEDGVGCESCHGAGSDYKKKPIMRDVQKARANGLIEATEKVCKQCHNEQSPTYKKFVFKERAKEIAHPRPKK